MTTIFLHGFWGAPADWAPVLARLPLDQRVWCPDLYADEGLTPEVEPLAWADRFLHRVRREVGAGEAQLVAYSMGGRLALHALLRVPKMFSRALILSARGWIDASEVEGRRAWERRWAKRFREDDWAALEAAWNEEPVLIGEPAPARRRAENLRDLLARSLEAWSPVKHAFTPDDLRETTARIDWAFGAEDQKYTAVAKQLRELPAGGQIAIIPDAGHRLPLTRPEFVVDWVNGGNGHE